MPTIAQLVPDVKAALANRVDVETRAPYYIRDAVRELTDDYDFAELEVVGPSFALTVGERQYTNVSFQVENTADLNRITIFEMFTDYPTNTRSVMLQYREPAVVMPMSRNSGMPATWTRYGNYIYMGSKPDKAYSVIAYYQKIHYFNETSLDALKGTLIQMPNSWLDILKYSAALKGALELRLPDFVVMYRNLLFGDPKHPGDLGILQARVSQHQKDKRTNAGNIPPIVMGYSS